ncbi:MAG TPA: hypothetical protein VFR32_07185 [Gaiellaceae bacterium]|nr:hypothetical protein [Gaiellaceae bacterium]
MSAGAATPTTADQRLVRDLQLAITSEKALVKRLAEVDTPFGRATKRALIARAKVAIAALGRASSRGAVGAQEVRPELARAKRLDTNVVAEISDASPDVARIRRLLKQALKVKNAALREFGMPLEDEFDVALEAGDLNVPGFDDDTRLYAAAPVDISSIVFGDDDRATAKAVEPATVERRQLATARRADALPITRVGPWFLIEREANTFRSGPCSVARGIVTCRFSPAMKPSESLNVAFGPKLPPKTKLLVKFRATSGQRAYEVITKP